MPMCGFSIPDAVVGMVGIMTTSAMPTAASVPTMRRPREALWLSAHDHFCAGRARVLHGRHNATDEQNLEWNDTDEVPEPRCDAVVQVAQDVEPDCSSEHCEGSQHPGVTASQGDHDCGDQHDGQRRCQRADVVDFQNQSAVKGGFEVDLSQLRRSAVDGGELSERLPSDDIACDRPARCSGESWGTEDDEIRDASSDSSRPAPVSPAVTHGAHGQSSGHRGQRGFVSGQVSETERHGSVGQRP